MSLRILAILYLGVAACGSDPDGSGALADLGHPTGDGDSPTPTYIPLQDAKLAYVGFLRIAYVARGDWLGGTGSALHKSCPNGGDFDLSGFKGQAGNERTWNFDVDVEECSDGTYVYDYKWSSKTQDSPDGDIIWDEKGTLVISGAVTGVCEVDLLADFWLMTDFDITDWTGKLCGNNLNHVDLSPMF